MELKQTLNGEKLSLVISGRIDTITSPDFQKCVLEMAEEVKLFDIDMTAVDYVSSAGLRVFALAGMEMKKRNGKLVINNMNSEVKKVFDMTGFSMLLGV